MINMHGVVQSNYSKIVRNGLVLWLDAMNDNSYSGSGAIWNDLTANNRSGSLTNGPTFNSANGGSIVFDGVDDFVNVNYTQTNALTYTIEAWVKTTATTNGQGIVQNRTSGADNTGKSLSLGITGTQGGGPSTTAGYLFFVVDSDAIGLGPYHTGKTFNDGNWHQLVGTLDIPTATTLNGTNENTYLKIFADGVALTSSLSTWGAGSVTSPFTGLGNMRIGNHQAWANNCFPGDIAIVRIYNVALSATEVLQNFNADRRRFGL